MADPSLLECFDNPNPQRDYVIEHVAEEFTSVCPKTGHPDFGTVTFRFVPDKLCIELKSLKLYLQSFRNDGIFYEAVTNQIASEVNDAMAPRWMQVQTSWAGRGGIRSVITIEVGRPPAPGSLADEAFDGGYEDDLPRSRPGDDEEDAHRPPPGF